MAPKLDAQTLFAFGVSLAQFSSDGALFYFIFRDKTIFKQSLEKSDLLLYLAFSKLFISYRLALSRVPSATKRKMVLLALVSPLLQKLR